MPHRYHTTLDQAGLNQPLIVSQVIAPEKMPEWQPWLEELGFITGEHAMVKKLPLIAGGAMVVRVGLSTFALHPAEAACVVVTQVEGLK